VAPAIHSIKRTGILGKLLSPKANALGCQVFLGTPKPLFSGADPAIRTHHCLVERLFQEGAYTLYFRFRIGYQAFAVYQSIALDGCETALPRRSAGTHAPGICNGAAAASRQRTWDDVTGVTPVVSETYLPLLTQP